MSQNRRAIVRYRTNASVIPNNELIASLLSFGSQLEVLETLLREKRPFILLADNGFRDYYKPSDHLFDACAEGRILILSPWKYNSDKRHISRSDCVALNNMAEEICNALNTPLASVAPDASVASDTIRQNKKE